MAIVSPMSDFNVNSSYCSSTLSAPTDEKALDDTIKSEGNSNAKVKCTKAPPTKPAWGGWKKPVSKKPLSFGDIMSEQLVQKTVEQDKAKAEHARKDDTPTTANSTDESADGNNADGSAQNPKATTTVEPIHTVDMDADFALALQLQQEYDARDEMRRPRNTSTKVQITGHRIGPAPYSVEALGHISSQQEFEGGEDWEYEADPNQQFITKHDPVLSGMKNTKRLAKQFNIRGLVEDRVLLNGRVANHLARHLKKKTVKGESRTGKRAKEDFATRGETLDQRTKLILFKWQQGDLLGNFHGCFRTGKEAHVYMANLPDGQEAAVKIFNTTVTKFTNRAEYIQDDHRFVSKLGNNSKNRRKLVQIWTEKEFKNLNRLYREGVPCPKPLFFKEHLLCMEFIGRDGQAALQLREASLSKKKVRRAYQQVIVNMWRMFNLCQIVHADLSEYNMLWHQNRVVIIDLGQALHSSHHKALDYLKRDCETVTKFFTKAGMSASKILSAPSLLKLVCTPLEIVHSKNKSDASDAIKSTEESFEEAADVDGLVLGLWQDMIASGQHQLKESQPITPNNNKGSGWKAEYKMRRKTADVDQHEAFEDMTSAQFESTL